MRWCLLHLIYLTIEFIFYFAEVRGYLIGRLVDDFEEFGFEALASGSKDLLKLLDHFLYVIEDQFQIDGDLG